MGEIERSDDNPQAGSLDQFLAPLQALQNLLEASQNQGVIIGGIAASLLGTPRFTADLDAVFIMSASEISGFLELAEGFGIKPRLPDAAEFARKNRVLLLRHADSGIDMDISMGALPFEIEMVERSRIREMGNIQLRLPTPEDLIILKAVAHRAKDLEDIRAISCKPS